MSYIRVIPRDLFNEANLLKCYGQLALHIHDHKYTTSPAFADLFADDAFQIEMSMDSGDIFIANLPLTIDGQEYELSRPMNSREPWPLWISGDGIEEPFEVFNPDGSISFLMSSLLNEGLKGYLRIKSDPFAGTPGDNW